MSEDTAWVAMDIIVDSSFAIPKGDGLSSDTVSRHPVSSLLCSGLPAPYCTRTHRTILHSLTCTALHAHAPRCTHMHRTCTALHHIALICTVLHRTALTSTALHSHAPHYITLHSHVPHCTHMHRTAEHCFHAHRTASYCTNMHSLASYCTNIHRDNALSAARPDNRDAWSHHTVQNQQSDTLACGTTARNAALVLLLFGAFWRVQHTHFW